MQKPGRMQSVYHTTIETVEQHGTTDKQLAGAIKNAKKKRCWSTSYLVPFRYIGRDAMVYPRPPIHAYRRRSFFFLLHAHASVTTRVSLIRISEHIRMSHCTAVAEPEIRL